MKVNELQIQNPVFFLFKQKVDEWVNDIAGWSGLDWDEEERIFKKMSQHDLENYMSIEYADNIAKKFNDNTDTTVLDSLSNAWNDFKLNPRNFENIIKKHFPSDIDENNTTSPGEATSSPKVFKKYKMKVNELKIKKNYFHEWKDSIVKHMETCVKDGIYVNSEIEKLKSLKTPEECINYLVKIEYLHDNDLDINYSLFYIKHGRYPTDSELGLDENNTTSPGEATSSPKVFKKLNEMQPIIRKGRRFNPPKFEFPSNLLKPLKFNLSDEGKIYFKIATNSKNESILMVDPLVKTALDSIERGRGSYEKEQKLSRLTQYLKERVPQNIRGLIKKYLSNAKILGTGFIALPLVMEKDGEQWYMMNPNKDDTINKDINVPLYELQVNNPNNIEKINNPDYIFYVINKNNKITSGWEYLEDAIDFKKENEDYMGPLRVYSKKYLIQKKKINPNNNASWNNNVNESKLYKFIKQQILKEASYNQFKKEVKLRSKNEMLHKGIKTVKAKLQEVDRIVEYMSRMKQELSENDEGTQYWDRTKQSISKIQEIADNINKKIKEL